MSVLISCDGPDESQAVAKSRYPSVRVAILLFICLLYCLPLLAQESEISGAATAQVAAFRHYYIEISIKSNLLTLYGRGKADKLVKLKEYKVGTVMRGLKIYPIGIGKVTAISFKPWWYPTPYSRSMFRERGILLPPAVPPGHHLNYMGDFKISLSHKTQKGAIYRIHGNNNSQRVGRRVTGGCFVMDNVEGQDLARMVPIGTMVNILP